MPNRSFILEESLGYIVGRAARSVGGLLNRNMALAGHEATCEQWSVLVNLAEKNGQTQQELAGHTCKDKTSMTRLIDGMEKHDLVVRIPDKQDKRQKLIYLTNKGKTLQKQLMPIVRHTLEQAEAGIDAQDVKLCMDVLCKVYANVIDLPQKQTVAPATNKKHKGLS